jgi:CubicO group peptidase (beta-lactamase class C family)
MQPVNRPDRREFLSAAGAAALAGSCELRGQPMTLPVAKPEDIGLDSKRLQVAYDLLESWCKEGSVPGGAILVGRKGKTVDTRLFGKMGPEPDAAPIRRDAMFLMASITKPVVYMAGMMLVERGLLNLNDPVVRYVPEFAAHGKESIIVQHLFTHTSGLPDMLPNNALMRKEHAPIEAFLAAAAKDTVPAFKAGTQVSYQSMGTAVVADIIQRITKMPVPAFLKKEMFDPLGLKSIGLGSQGFDRERLVRVTLQDYMIGTDFHWNSKYWQELGSPWGGLFSTADDFASICQLLLNGGTLNDVKLLSPLTVKMMTTNRLDDYPELPEGTRRTLPWGLGWRLNHPGTNESWGDLLGRHVYGHTGATGTTVWMDPDTGVFCILLTSAVREKAPWRLVNLSNIVAGAVR